MSPTTIRLVIDELASFMSRTYSTSLPNSLLIAQSFILKYPEYGKELGLMEINKIIEKNNKNVLKQMVHKAHNKEKRREKDS